MTSRLTIESAVAHATRRFVVAGIGAPRREAIHLVADLLDFEPAEFALRRDEVIEPERRRWVDRGVERRALGEPLAYVTGLVGFRHLVLRADSRALIPRPETEGLVDRALALASSGVAVDIGTGTGCLALSLRHEGGYRQVVAVDRSRDALRLAEQNARRTGLAVGFACGDWATAIGSGVVDLLVANPPYLSASEYRDLDPAVRDYEPGVALVSGDDGLDATRSGLADGWRVVRAGGVVVMEIATARAEESAAIARALGWLDVRVDDDIFGRARYLVARRGRAP